MKSLLAPFSFVYEMIMKCRNLFYDKGIFSTLESPVTVVSVGNLTMGGTGKTPIICELLKWAISQNLKPAMISRGYKGKFKDIAKVMPPAEAQIYGDEPAMVANRFPHIPIYVGGDRTQVLAQMLREEKVNIVFADDAFQHRRLGRHIDILVVDCTEDLKNYRVLPLGRGRESASHLSRADFVILNKVNLATPEAKQKALDFISLNSRERDIPVIECEYHLNQITSLDGSKGEWPQRYEKIILVSGIGQPNGFEKLMSQHFHILKHITFSDHHSYSESEIHKVVDELNKTGAEKVIFTEKDAVKVKKFSSLLPKAWVAEINPKLSLRARGLYEQILAKIN